MHCACSSELGCDFLGMERIGVSSVWEIEELVSCQHTGSAAHRSPDLDIPYFHAA